MSNLTTTLTSIGTEKLFPGTKVILVQDNNDAIHFPVRDAANERQHANQQGNNATRKPITFNFVGSDGAMGVVSSNSASAQLGLKPASLKSAAEFNNRGDYNGAFTMANSRNPRPEAALAYDYDELLNAPPGMLGVPCFAGTPSVNGGSDHKKQQLATTSRSTRFNLDEADSIDDEEQDHGDEEVVRGTNKNAKEKEAAASEAAAGTRRARRKPTEEEKVQSNAKRRQTIARNKAIREEAEEEQRKKMESKKKGTKKDAAKDIASKSTDAAMKDSVHKDVANEDGGNDDGRNENGGKEVGQEDGAEANGLNDEIIVVEAPNKDIADKSEDVGAQNAMTTAKHPAPANAATGSAALALQSPISPPKHGLPLPAPPMSASSPSLTSELPALKRKGDGSSRSSLLAKKSRLSYFPHESNEGI